MVILTNDDEAKNYWNKKNLQTFLNIRILASDTSEVATMRSMFPNNKSVESILGLTNFDTSNCSDFTYMFNGCESLKQVDIQNFNVKKAESFCSIFSGCNFDVLDLRNWKFNDPAASFVSLFGSNLKFPKKVIFDISYFYILKIIWRKYNFVYNFDQSNKRILIVSSENVYDACGKDSLSTYKNLSCWEKCMITCCCCFL